MKKFPDLNLPPVDLRLKEENRETKIYDPLRDKWILLTPEEWVRQHFTSYLTTNFHYPPSLMANEVTVDVNGQRKRCDTTVYRPDGSHLLVVEYKAPDIPITQAVFDQVVRYNMALHADYLIVSNGINHYCCKIDYKANTYYFIRQIPDYYHIASGASQN